MKLTAKDICDIVRACHEAKVTKIKLGSVSIELALQPIEHHIHMPNPTSDQSGTIPTGLVEEEERPQEMSQAHLDYLLINDPLEFENIVSGGLGDGRKED